VYSSPTGSRKRSRSTPSTRTIPIPRSARHHYALLFHDEMLETLVLGIESRLVTGTMGAILEDLVGRLTQQPYRAG
jgi:hypothetical protein